MADKKRIFLDMDGTLVAFKKIEVKNYEGLLDAKDYLNSKGYFLNAEPHQNVIDAVKLLAKEHADEVELFICSAVYDDALYAKDDKNAFLDLYLPEIDASHRIFTVCGEDKKMFIEGGVRPDDYLIDDLTRNLKNWQPPAMGIKLLNGINHTNQTWQGDMISFAKNPKQIAEDIYKITVLGEHIKDAPPITYEEFQIMHSITANPYKNRNENTAFKNQSKAVFELWDKILRDPAFVSAEVPLGNVTYLLTKASKEEYDFQLSSIDRDGILLGQMDLNMDSACDPKDSLYHLGAVEYMSKFYGTEEHIMTLKILKSIQMEGEKGDRDLKADTETPSPSKEFSFEESGRSLLLYENNVKLRAMETHLFSLKKEQKGEEFKLFYDFVYLPQKGKLGNLLGYSLVNEELASYREKTESPFYCLAEKTVKALNLDMGNQLNETEMNRLVDEKWYEFSHGSPELVQTLYENAVNGNASCLSILACYSKELSFSTGSDLKLSDVFMTQSLQDFLVKQNPSAEMLDKMFSAMQNMGMNLNTSLVLEHADSVSVYQDVSFDKKVLSEELAVCTSCCRELLEVKSRLKENKNLVKEISAVEKDTKGLSKNLLNSSHKNKVSTENKEKKGSHIKGKDR